MWLQKQVARLYSYGAAFTAGKLKSHQMLLERALLLLRSAREGDLQSRDRIQDIVAHLQSSLDLRYPAAKDLFVVYGHLWDALEEATPETFDRSDDLIRSLRDLVVEVHRRQPRPVSKKKLAKPPSDS